MIGFPRTCCQFDNHKGPQEVSKVTCGHFQYVSVPRTCEFDPQKKFSNQTYERKKFSASWLVFQGCFASLKPTEVFRRSQKTLGGTSNMFLCLGHVNLTHRTSSPTKPKKEQSSLCHDWFFNDVLPVWYPQRSSQGLKRHLWTLLICLCALDKWLWPTEKHFQPNLGEE